MAANAVHVQSGAILQVSPMLTGDAVGVEVPNVEVQAGTTGDHADGAMGNGCTLNAVARPGGDVDPEASSVPGGDGGTAVAVDASDAGTGDLQVIEARVVDRGTGKVIHDGVRDGHVVPSDGEGDRVDGEAAGGVRRVVRGIPGVLATHNGGPFSEGEHGSVSGGHSSVRLGHVHIHAGGNGHRACQGEVSDDLPDPEDSRIIEEGLQGGRLIPQRQGSLSGHSCGGLCTLCV
ncbi:hypothetical protein ACFFX0_10070 [Citricoccus parietis]|uniref:Uncharacterized protein n=1 Tax=Citricoccus parietis TaxID=592307 RepID=A0ABV5FXW6_9MICC